MTANSVKAKVMLEKRIKHQRIIIKEKAQNNAKNEAVAFDKEQTEAAAGSSVHQEEADEETVQEAFSTVIAQKKRTSRKPFDPSQPKKKRAKPAPTKDDENYIPYVAKDYQTESG